MRTVDEPTIWTEFTTEIFRVSERQEMEDRLRKLGTENWEIGAAVPNGDVFLVILQRKRVKP